MRFAYILALGAIFTLALSEEDGLPSPYEEDEELALGHFWWDAKPQHGHGGGHSHQHGGHSHQHGGHSHQHGGHSHQKESVPSGVCDESVTGKGGSGYRGCQTHTVSGKVCQKWTAQYPNRHSKTPAAFPGMGLGDHNYCRNPDKSASGKYDSGIWCYVADGSKRWELCKPLPVRVTPPPPPPAPQACGDESVTGTGGSGYRGCQDHTLSGKVCQKWTAQSPNRHSKTPAAFPGMGLGDHNYCRNPDKSASGKYDSGIWCYVADGSKRWELCKPLPSRPVVIPAIPSGPIIASNWFGENCACYDQCETAPTNAKAKYCSCSTWWNEPGANRCQKCCGPRVTGVTFTSKTEAAQICLAYLGDQTSSSSCQPDTCLDDVKNVAECMCGPKKCPAGQYCYAGGCWPHPPMCMGAGKILSVCSCGSQTCPIGQYCYYGSCHATPEKCEQNPFAMVGHTCECGRSRCSPEQYCYGNQCHDKPTPPACGASSGYSYAPLAEQQVGTVLEWIGKVSEDCLCGGNTHCPAGNYCWSNGNCGRQPENCFASEIVPLAHECTCAGRVCPWGHYCYDGSCHQNPKPQHPHCDGSGRTFMQCMCGNYVCEPNMFCYNNRCNPNPLPCTPAGAFEEEPITYECTCGRTPCPVGHYCVDGQCQDKPKKPECPMHTVDSLTQSCDCYGSSCNSGKYCYQGGCQPKPMQCVENAWNRVPETCMCSGAKCDGYCFDGLCEDHPRKPCTSGLVVTDNFPGKKNGFGQDGQYFGFDDEMAQHFFDTKGYSNQSFKIRNSRGYRGMIKVYAHSKNCGFCGRFNPKSEAERSDWKTGDIICMDNEDDVPALPKPYPLSRCHDALQVTDGHPGHYLAKGRFFGFDNECMDIWYGSSNWHYKKIMIKHPDGKIGYVRFFKDNKYCKMSCARWEPKPLALKGDWTLNDLVVRAVNKCGSGVLPAECTCGSNKCQAGQMCSNGRCTGQCANGLVHSTCLCGGSNCFSGHSCLSGSCLPSCAAGGVTNSNCACGTNTCYSGQICKNGQCVAPSNNCATNVLLHAGCDCGNNECYSGQMCIGGQCVKQCSNGPVSSSCQCGGSTCNTGNVCLSGQCLPHCPAGGAVAGACACGSNSCSKGQTCEDGRCVIKEEGRKCKNNVQRPAEYLEIWPISSVTSDRKGPGYHFEFDRKKAEKYFKTSPNWKYTSSGLLFVTSCGDRWELDIFRKGTSCSSDGQQHDCGKYTTSPQNGDWTIEDSFSRSGEKRWIALASRMTAEELELAGVSESSSTSHFLMIGCLLLMSGALGYYYARRQNAQKNASYSALPGKNDVEMSAQ